MQTSTRIWVESIKLRNWIDNILGRGSELTPNYVDVGVQTNVNGADQYAAVSMWETVKDFFLQTFSV